MAASHDAQAYSKRLFDLILMHFSESELRDLCFKLDVDYENLPGAKADQARELIVYMVHHGRLAELVAACIKMFPNVDWSGRQTTLPPAPAPSAVPEVPEVKNRLPRWPWVLIVIMALGLVVVVVALRIVNPTPPRFTVSAIHTLDGTNQYEITDNLIDYGRVEGLELTWGFEIIPNYEGAPLGEVQVLVKKQNGQIVARDRWPTFTKDPPRLRMQLDAYSLVNLVQHTPVTFSIDNYTYPATTLSVEIVEARNPNHPLHTDTLKLINTPWYHLTRVSPGVLSKENETVDVLVTGRNLGGPSNFDLITEVYEINDLAGRRYFPWEKKTYAIKGVDGLIERNQGFSVRVVLPSEGEKPFAFEPGKSYAIYSYVIKRQNYVNENWDEMWRFADPGDYALVYYPTK